ncbi:MAG TPA: poly(3-hydroxybutyrate) depolymerase [Hyphomicrobiaceae bacterium]|nr:poly(3-hydroxybutyrate) depolymerase [Hyphomicrobiaceae bacterium]
MNLRLARYFVRKLGAVAGIGLLALLAACQPDVPNLPAVRARLDGTTVSGVSSGAYMAGQVHLAHNKIVTGAALVAGGPYGCAQSVYTRGIVGPGSALINASRAINGCMGNDLAAWGVPNPQQLAEQAEAFAREGRIDPIEATAGDRIYLFSGTKDETVLPEIGLAALHFYERIGVPADRIKRIADVPAGHGFIAKGKGGSCGASARPFINDCAYDQAGDLLAYLLGPLAPPDSAASVERLVFDQHAFTGDLIDHGLAREGVVLMPERCRQEAGCRVHVVFHGCRQSRAEVGDAFIEDSGYARWAGPNRLIVLMPQAQSSTANPYGCWDWWGYSGSEYLTRKGPQIVAVRRMLDRLAAAE